MRKLVNVVIYVLALCLTNAWTYIVDPGPQIKASIGMVWPKPMNIRRNDKFFTIDPENFKFSIVDNTCDILDDAIKRYTAIIKANLHSPVHNFNISTDLKHSTPIREIFLNLTEPCERLPHLKMDEWYFLTGSGKIIAHSIWGMLRGMETYSQLVTPGLYNMLLVPEIRIRDSPRYPHRGLLLDTSRHYISTSTILKILDGMSYNKLNVFHWHIVDDQSFPYESIKFPELSEKGAYMPSMVYTQKNISNIIEYARMRGIRVMAEFDVPGHTRSWGNSHPEVLTACGQDYIGKLGPINPIKETSYKFLDDLFSEILNVFPDKFIHLGGDEVGFECWKSNEEIRKYVKTEETTYEDLQKDFMERITSMITTNFFTPVVWQEAMVENVKMPKGTVVQVWLGEWRSLFRKFTEAGHRVILSQCWYLDHLSTGGDWLKYYSCDPDDFSGTVEQKKLVMGGEACMWSEVVSDSNVIQRIFPRVSAAAERLWSPKYTEKMNDVKKRLEEHTCRMISRGISAQPPTGPGFC